MALTYYFAPTSYHVGSHARQQTDMTFSVLEKARVLESNAVLDIGCGQGQTLQHVGDLNRRAVLIGVDPDEQACRLGREASGRIHFLKAEGERLPLADGSIDFAICRVAMNYMHQPSALGEMCRVLAPGGKIVLSFIGFGYCLREVIGRGQGPVRRRLGSIKDLLAGIALQLAGWQARRPRFWGRSVPYTACARLQRQLQTHGCEITWRNHEDRYFGCATIWWVIITKQDKCH